MRKWMAALLCCVACTPTYTPRQEARGERWVAYYDNTLPASTFKNYDLVVFDREHYPDFTSIKHDTTVLAYVSIGEVHGHAKDLDALRKAGILRGAREHWGSYAVDIGAPEWKTLVFKKIDDAMKKGFAGVMLDTVDSAIYVAEQESPNEGEKAKADAAILIAEIRARYPQAKLMLNRGFAILPAVARKIDFALAESTLTQTDVSTGQSKLFSPNSYYLSVSRLEEARQNAPQLKIYTLDYWNQDDVRGIHHIYATQRARGYSPYVSTPDLRRYTPEPQTVGEDEHA